MITTIAVLITCFNRRDKTLACLRRLNSQQLPPGHQLRVYLVDDGCSDGTGDAVRDEFPDVNVIPGNGSLYWAGGMRFAWNEAAKDNPDYFLLLNDDTEIVPDAISTLLQVAGSPQATVIAVGAIADPHSHRLTYGAYLTGTLGIMPCTETFENCSTFNGNCVLIPCAAASKVGTLDEKFPHSMADSDYGLRASKRGINIIQAKGILGYCSNNPVSKTWRDPEVPRWKRLQLSQRPTALPWRPWLHYCLRHHPGSWPLRFTCPYLRILAGR